MWHGVPFVHQLRQVVGTLRLYRLLRGLFDCFSFLFEFVTLKVSLSVLGRTPES